MLECCLSRLQSMPGVIGLSSFLLAFLIISEHSFVIWINEINSSQFSSLVKLRFLCSPFLLFSILSDFYLFSSKLLATQSGLHDFWTAKIPLVASSIHEIPQYNHTLFWNSSRIPISGFATTFLMLSCLLHGMAGAISLPSFLLAFLRIPLFSSSSGSIK